MVPVTRPGASKSVDSMRAVALEAGGGLRGSGRGNGRQRTVAVVVGGQGMVAIGVIAACVIKSRLLADKQLTSILARWL